MKLAANLLVEALLGNPDDSIMLSTQLLKAVMPMGNRLGI